LLPKEVYRWKIHDKFTGGVPDAYYEGPKGFLWVEYKYIKTLPKRASTPIKIGLSALQTQWLNRATNNDIPCIVVVGNNNHCLVLRNKRWTYPISTDYYELCKVSNKDLAMLISDRVTGQKQ
jgi:hypothetical protein